MREVITNVSFVHLWKYLYDQEQSSGGVLLKKLFLKILQNSQENACARDSFLIKLQA